MTVRFTQVEYPWDRPDLQVHFTDRDQQVWIACYAASFARQLHDYMDQGRGCPEDEVAEGFREEAASVANMALGID